MKGSVREPPPETEADGTMNWLVSHYVKWEGVSSGMWKDDYEEGGLA